MTGDKFGGIIEKLTIKPINMSHISYCDSCKKESNHTDGWLRITTWGGQNFLMEGAENLVSLDMCPDCSIKYYKLLAKFLGKKLVIKKEEK